MPSGDGHRDTLQTHLHSSARPPSRSHRWDPPPRWRHRSAPRTRRPRSRHRPKAHRTRCRRSSRRRPCCHPQPRRSPRWCSLVVVLANGSVIHSLCHARIGQHFCPCSPAQARSTLPPSQPSAHSQGLFLVWAAFALVRGQLDEVVPSQQPCRAGRFHVSPAQPMPRGARPHSSGGFVLHGVKCRRRTSQRLLASRPGRRTWTSDPIVEGSDRSHPCPPWPGQPSGLSGAMLCRSGSSSSWCMPLSPSSGSPSSGGKGLFVPSILYSPPACSRRQGCRSPWRCPLQVAAKKGSSRKTFCKM